MHTRTPRALVAAAALALLTGACTDTPTAGSAAAGGMPSLSSSSGPALVSNAVRYRDAGGRPATGRSGNAVVDALAVLDPAGNTTLLLSARHATDPSITGSIDRVQVKASSPDGKYRFTRVLPVVAGEVRLQGMARGDEIQLQTNVQGVDASRTDVVTVTGRVRRLPDLRVDLSTPAQVEAGTPVNVLAVVSEHNGDLGTRASCELWADGQRVDVAHNVWVDAGDAVTCAFTYTFPAAGAYALEARAVPTGLADWNPADNRDTAIVVVNGASAQFYTTAYFDQQTIVDSSAAFDTWRDGASGMAFEYRSSYAQTVANQSAQMYGYMPAAIAAPAVLRVSMSTGGAGVHAAEWVYPADAPCVDQVDGRALFSLCSSGGFTSFSYLWVAGSVTYHSQGFNRLWDDVTGADYYVYHWNDTSAPGEPIVPAGEDWTLDVRVVTAGGEHVGTQAIRLTRSVPWQSVFPYSCAQLDQPEWSYTRTYCSGSSSRTEVVSGFAAG
ncbi:hypothetical protein [Longimicrobium sp.]|uniref:hypothetical protein n=1 Tax=Longimicrobium sp. TaxID=2029185 RepID=UPI002E2F6337|nr:hypothetical protein [Longimicrobium sp.]HEX6041351.1 hypothetical protein [Longimicrobium sp.]